MNIEEMLSIANSKQKLLLLDAVKEFEEEVSKFSESDGITLNNSVNAQYRNLAVKYQKKFAEILKL